MTMKGNGAEEEAVPRRLQIDVLDRHLEPGRVAEVAGREVGEEVPVADEERPVQAHLSGQVLDLLRSRVGAEDLPGDVAGRELAQREHQERDDEQRQEQEEQVLEEEPSHLFTKACSASHAPLQQ